MVASVTGGGLMFAVHLLNKMIPRGEYAAFGAMLVVVINIPTIPLQMVLAQQTALAMAQDRVRQLRGLLRMTLLGSFLVWSVAAMALLAMQGTIVELWKISNPLGLWAMALAVLLSLWIPLFLGLMQGAQDFLWLGWAMLVQSIGRVLFSALIVVLLGGMAAGMMTGVLLGLVFAVILSAWRTRSLWIGPVEAFDWKPLLKQVLPLLAGFWACQFLFTADTLFIKRFFGAEESSAYVAAGTLSRGLVWLVAPLVAVMFPKIVHATAKAEKSNLMGLTMACTAVLVALGGVFLVLIGPLVLKQMYDPSYLEAGLKILPWYAGAMVPMSLANVLANSLLARGDYRAVPILLALVGGFIVTLTYVHQSPVQVLQVLTVFTTLLFLACAVLSWIWKATPKQTLVAPIPTA
jgi:O-antigen/teichoic acid export membrane protein